MDTSQAETVKQRKIVRKVRWYQYFSSKHWNICLRLVSFIAANVSGWELCVSEIYPVDLVLYPYKSSKTKRFDPLGRFQVPLSPLPGTKVPGFPKSTQRIETYQGSNQMHYLYLVNICISPLSFRTLNLLLIYQNLFIYNPSIYLSQWESCPPIFGASTSPPVLFVDLPSWTPLPLIQRYQWAGNPVVTQSRSLQWQFGEVFGQGSGCGKASLKYPNCFTNIAMESNTMLMVLVTKYLPGKTRICSIAILVLLENTRLTSCKFLKHWQMALNSMSKRVYDIS